MLPNSDAEKLGVFMLDQAIREIKSGARGFNRNEVFALAINEGYSANHAQELSNALHDAVQSDWQSVSVLLDTLEMRGYSDLIGELAQW
ncbi:hypothetical protein DU002_01795 [Corallincola holothuriorum]|uniref:Uncharacterized protein n=3 Tax=Corallincola TaxID=1775176 RepID=A0A368NQ99_9GAMM|nr:hypothetical protein DU002_01795 [Corallincola holothuriorum]